MPERKTFTYSEIADAWNSEGIGGAYTKKIGSNKEQGKKNSELTILSDWASAMKSARTEVSNISFPKQDPPDARCEVNGVPRTVEISSLVNQDFKRAFHAKKSERCGPNHGKGFDLLWASANEFTTRLEALVEKKAAAVRKAPHCATPVDIFLICSLEPFLTSEMLEKEISRGYRIACQDAFHDVQLLLDYEVIANAHAQASKPFDPNQHKTSCNPLFSMTRGQRLDCAE